MTGINGQEHMRVPEDFPRDVQLALNRGLLPTTHLATNTEIVRHEGYLCVATFIRPVIGSDVRSFSILQSLEDGITAYGIAKYITERFYNAINEDDHERASQSFAFCGTRA